MRVAVAMSRSTLVFAATAAALLGVLVHIVRQPNAPHAAPLQPPPAPQTPVASVPSEPPASPPAAKATLPPAATSAPPAVPLFVEPSHWSRAWAPGGALASAAHAPRPVDRHLERFHRKLIGRPQRLDDVLVLVPLAGAALEIEYLAERYHTVAIDAEEGALRQFWQRYGRPREEGDTAAVCAASTAAAAATVEDDVSSPSVPPLPPSPAAAVTSASGCSMPVWRAVVDRTVDPVTGGVITGPTMTYILGNVTRVTRQHLAAAGGGALPRSAVTAVWDRHSLDAIDPPLRLAYAHAITRLAAPGARMLVVVADDSVDCSSCAAEEDGSASACDASDYETADDDRLAARSRPFAPPFPVYASSLRRLYGAHWRIDKLHRDAMSGEVVYLLTRTDHPPPTPTPVPTAVAEALVPEEGAAAPAPSAAAAGTAAGAGGASLAPRKRAPSSAAA